MSGIIGALGGRPQAASAPALTGVQLQTSVTGRCVPVIYGTVRAAPNVLYYADFASQQVATGGKGGVIGGGGKGQSSGQFTYSATVILAACEGPVEGWGQAWASKTPTSLAELGLTSFNGTYPQAVWGYVTTFHPADARPYNGIAYVAAAPYQFGSSAQIPNNNFEVYGYGSRRAVYQTGLVPGGSFRITVGVRTWGNGTVVSLWADDLASVVDSLGNVFVKVGGIPAAGQFAVAAGVYSFNAADVGKTVTIAYTGIGQDADPAGIATDILTNVHYGVGFPPDLVGELSVTTDTLIVPAGTAGAIPRRGLEPVPGAARVPILVRPPGMAQPVPPSSRSALVISPPPTPPILLRGALRAAVSGGDPPMWWGGAPASPTTIPLARIEQDPSVPAPPIYADAPGPAALTPAAKQAQITGATSLVILPVTNPAGWVENLAVQQVGGDLWTCVASAPGPLQYVVQDGTYIFNSADAGKTVSISYIVQAGLDTYRNYCWAAGLFLSPGYFDQQQAASVVDEIAKVTNSEWVWSAGALKLVPRGDQALTANGHTYTPPASAAADLNDDHFQALGDDPVSVPRKRSSDRDNVVQMEFRNRANAYNTEAVEATDQAMVDQFGRRTSGSIRADGITTDVVARLSAQLMLQRQAVRNGAAFTLDSRFAYLDPMDIVTVTDSALGFAQKSFRITDLVEREDGKWDVNTEDYLVGVGHAPSFAVAVGTGFAADYGADPGSINAPVIFEPPVQIANNSGLELWLAFAGSNPGFGGGDVWVSSDGVNYRFVGRRDGRSRMGATTAAFPAVADPDTSNTLKVDLSSSLGQIIGGTSIDADQGHTLCLVDSELVAFQDAILTGAYTYDLKTRIRRGMYGTTAAAHAPSAPFARLDEATFVYPYDKSQIGQTLHIKVRAFNVYGGGLQDLSQCVDYTHVIAGPPTPLAVQNFAVSQAGLAVVLSWTDLSDPSVKGYDILYGAQGGTVDTATLLTVASRTTEITSAAVGPGSWTFYIRARNIADQTGPVASTNATVSQFSQLFDASGTWLKPNGLTPTSLVFVELWGGGGGGNAPSTGSTAGGGGGGGAYVAAFFLASQIGAVETVTLGAGAAGATGGLAAEGAGGHTTFGVWLTAYAGATGQSNLGGGGGGALSDGDSITGNGGGPVGGNSGSPGPVTDSADGGGGGAVSAVAGGASTRGGGGGGGGSSPSAVGNGGRAVFGGGGGAGAIGAALGVGGTSVIAGAGGAGQTGTGSPGVAPSGGGGGSGTLGQRGGAGARGRARITIVA